MDNYEWFAQFFLELEMVQKEVVAKIKTPFMFGFLFENRVVY
jgi:hypothetical protein